MADEGPPIPPAKEQAIFDPYTSVHDHGEQMGSVGLGLYISKTLARAMGGELTYRHDGRWSLFELVVPTGGPSGGAEPADEPRDGEAPPELPDVDPVAAV